jgi:primosomal protein N''
MYLKEIRELEEQIEQLEAKLEILYEIENTGKAQCIKCKKHKPMTRKIDPSLFICHDCFDWVKERIQKQVQKLKEMPYTDYLKTSHWLNLKKKAIKKAKNKCQKCSKSGVTLHVHHLTYERRGEEKMSDLLVVCKPCHEAIHGRKF